MQRLILPSWFIGFDNLAKWVHLGVDGIRLWIFRIVFL